MGKIGTIHATQQALEMPPYYTDAPVDYDYQGFVVSSAETEWVGRDGNAVRKVIFRDSYACNVLRQRYASGLYICDHVPDYWVETGRWQRKED